MDPTACYKEMMEAWDIGDTEAAKEHAINLVNWIDKSGCYPSNCYHDSKVNMVHVHHLSSALYMITSLNNTTFEKPSTKALPHNDWLQTNAVKPPANKVVLLCRLSPTNPSRNWISTGTMDIDGNYITHDHIDNILVEETIPNYWKPVEYPKCEFDPIEKGC